MALYFPDSRDQAEFLAAVLTGIIDDPVNLEAVAPARSISSIIHRLLSTKHPVFSPQVFLVALHYIKMALLSARRKLAKGSSPYLFLVAVILSQKFLHDHPLRNSAWSRLVHVPVRVISKLEFELLASLDHSLYISAEAFQDWNNTIQQLAVKWQKQRCLPLSPISPVLNTPFAPLLVSTNWSPATSCPFPVKRRRSFDDSVLSARKHPKK